MAGKETRIINFFDRESKVRDFAFRQDPILGYEQERRQEAVLALLDLETGERVLDVGCGNGRDLLPMLSSGAEYVGIDLSAGMLAAAKSKGEGYADFSVHLVLASATNLPFRFHSFDKALCSEVIEHIPEWHSVLRELKRATKKNGAVVFSTPNWNSAYGLQRRIVQRLKGWRHPYDDWKTYHVLFSALTASNLRPESVMGACYLPGQLCYLRSIRSLVSFVLPALRRLEVRFLRSNRVTRLFGYMICVKARSSEPWDALLVGFKISAREVVLPVSEHGPSTRASH